MNHGSTESHSQTETTGLKQWVFVFLATYTLLQSPESPPVVSSRSYDLLFFSSPLDATLQVNHFVSHILKSFRSGSGMCAFFYFLDSFRNFFLPEVVLSILVSGSL